MKRAQALFLFTISLTVAMTPSLARAQFWSRVGSGFSYYWGEAKTSMIQTTLSRWDSVMGNSCGDLTPRTARALVTAPACRETPSDVDDFVETAFFSAGAKIAINDQRCQIKRYQNYSSSSPESKAAMRALTEDLRPKLSDLRLRYQKIQTLAREMQNHPANVYIRRDGGVPPSPQMVQTYLDKTRAGWDELARQQTEFNKLLFTSPVAHFPEGQQLLQTLVAENKPLTDDSIRSAYAKAAADITQDLKRLQRAEVPGQPGTFDLSRNDKIFLLKQGEPASWFKHDKTSEAEATKLMCNMSRVYESGESVANGVLTLGTYAFGLEGYLVKVAFAAKFAAMAARARSGLVSLETMNLLSWGAWSLSAIDGAVKACGIPTTHVGRSTKTCDIDPKSEVLTMEKHNCALGLAMAGGALVFTAATTKLGQRAVDAAKTEMASHLPFKNPRKN